MKELKYVLIAAGVLGIIAAFLPFISMSEGPVSVSLSLWDIRKFPQGLTEGLLNGPKQVYVALVLFAIPAVLGVLAAVGKLSRWHGIVAAIFFLLTFAVEGVRKGISSYQGVDTAIGGKLLFIAAILGLVAAIAATVKPEPRTA